jgi:4-hydroxysphinganine ceramide fatty acyl 2-hydroxylase
MAKNYVSNKDETVRMFENNFMEVLSRVHPSVPVIIYLPLIVIMLYYSVTTYSVSFVNILLLMVAGMFVWTFVEYVLHKYIFHFNATSEFGKKIHFIFHGVHHDYPSDSRRLVMPPSVSIPLAVLFYFLFRYLIGEVYHLPFFSGFIIGYLFYDITHYAIHHFNMHNKFLLAIKNHHMLHHYQHPNKGYGVSSPFWDLVFKSTFEKKKK